MSTRNYHTTMWSYAFLSALYLCGVATALPGGCGGKLGILNVTSPDYSDLVWTCAGINPRSLYASGQNYLYAATTKANVSACANYCGEFGGMNAAVFYTNKTCACWEFGDVVTSPSAADSKSNNATYIDFYETGPLYRPAEPRDWGVFTCPAGAWSIYATYPICYPLNFKPAGPPLVNLGNQGSACGHLCASHNAHYAVLENWGNCSCYESLGGLKVAYNYTSPYQLIDIYDFVSHTTSSTKTTTTKKPTSTKKTTTTKKTSTAKKTTTTKKPTTTKKATTAKKTTTTKKTATAKKSTTTKKAT